MSVDVQQERDRLDDARGWEWAIITLHPVTYIAAFVVWFGGLGWPGLHWHLVGAVWALTIGIGLFRTGRRRAGR